MLEEGYKKWSSLFTSEAEDLWNTGPNELRMLKVIYHVLQTEFRRLECEISEKMKTVKHKVKLANLEESGFNDNSQLSPKENAVDELITLEESPKINRNRKVNRRKGNSPSLLNNSKKDFNQSSFSLLNPKAEAANDTFDCESLSSVVLYDPDLVEVVNSSVIGDDAGVNNSKKFKRTNLKKKCDVTLTQLLELDASSSRHSTTNDQKNINENDGNNSSTMWKHKQKPKSTLFKYYDRLPKKKLDIPEHPHKTETVRGKAERMKLPGWSCQECQDYYKDFDLPPEELKKKMDTCSRHRNRFEPHNETPKGFWDVTIFSSEED